MKTILCIWSILIYINVLYAQIPNGGFENWELQDIEVPNDWDVNICESKFKKDTISIEGAYSLKMSAANSDFCVCQISNSFDVTDIDASKSLYFSIKTASLNDEGSAYFNLGIILKTGDSINQIYNWVTNNEIQEFVEIEIPFTDLESNDTDNIFLRFSGVAEIGGSEDCMHFSSAWIDGLKIDSSSGYTPIEKLDKSELIIYPNPSSGEFFIDASNHSLKTYKIINLQGKIIEQGNLNTMQLSLKKPGLYLLLLETNDRPSIIIAKKLFIDK